MVVDGVALPMTMLLVGRFGTVDCSVLTRGHLPGSSAAGVRQPTSQPAPPNEVTRSLGAKERYTGWPLRGREPE